MKSAFARDCLKDRTILITGGCGAIGQVVVQKLAQHGATVAVNDIVDHRQAREVLPKDSRVAYFPADITQEGEVKRLFKSVAKKFRPPDIVLCHAGMVLSGPVLDYTVENWEKTMAVNLTSAFLVAREAGRIMKGSASAQRPGKILFTSSWVQDVPWPEIAAYTASKSGMKMLMRTMARELAPSHILINAVAPGIVAVGLAKREWDEKPSYQARAKRAIPLGFMQPPETVADAYLFLCSDAANYILGATLVVDGGCSLYPMD